MKKVNFPAIFEVSEVFNCTQLLFMLLKFQHTIFNLKFTFKQKKFTHQS